MKRPRRGWKKLLTKAEVHANKLKSQRKWRKNNPEKQKASTENWKKNNPASYKRSQRKRKREHGAELRAYAKGFFAGKRLALKRMAEEIANLKNNKAA